MGKVSQILLRAQQYSAVGPSRAEEGAIQWYWTAAGYLSSWLIAGGLLMLPASYDEYDDYRVSKTGISIFAIVLISIGLCSTMLLVRAFHDWSFRAISIILPAFSACLLGCLTIWYCFIVHSRYAWKVPGILCALFSSLLTAFFAIFAAFALHCAALDKARLRSQRNTSRQTAYEGHQLGDPIMHNDVSRVTDRSGISRRPDAELASARLNEHGGSYTTPVPPAFQMARSHSHPDVVSAIDGFDPQPFPRFHDSVSVLSERPSAATLHQRPSSTSLDNSMARPSSLSEEELLRQQMLMLLTTKPHDATLAPDETPRGSSSYGYRIDWRPADEDSDSPATERRISRHRSEFSFEPDTQELRNEVLAEVDAGNLPAGYFERRWDGVWREASDLPEGPLHPAFRESRFLKTGGASREQRRREIERNRQSS